ncbi:hypothetical protein LCGC14_0560280 [marine sediment metagenome]|uniref:Uncharacterized protein n=1 Tax=marine sediment metagenome TaxID=412755 RepID=A0A0F9RM56_9ZZZZ
MEKVDRLVSIVKDLEKNWKEIKKKYNLENIDCCVILELEEDRITLG